MNIGVVEKAISSLGRGFDITNDFRLKFCKGKKRLVLMNESETKEIIIPGLIHPVQGVPLDVKCDKGDHIRYQSDVLEFNQMSALFNQKSCLPGKIPSGLFNAMFRFNSSSWASDATDTKCLALDGYFISLFNLQIDRYPLILSDHVRNAVPSSWQPHALARFIENYGTHIIVGMSVGGQDMVFVRQDQSSNLQPCELQKHLNNLGDQLFTGSCVLPPLHAKTKGHKNKIPEAFNVFDPQPDLIDCLRSVSSRDGITVICSKRGGHLTAESHSEWLLTLPSTPDVINMSFVPIISLLKDVPGRGFLSHAINLYLRYKPPISELEYFLDFQSHKIWAPVHSYFPLGPPADWALSKPSLQFNFIGPKLYVNTAQVTVGRSPVTGMRLYLEGQKCNKLAIHLQHLSAVPQVIEQQMQADSSTMMVWRGSDEVADERYYEPVQWKKFSHVCIAPVRHDPARAAAAVFVVSGAQLHVARHDSKHVLHLRLLFSKLSRSLVSRSIWERGPTPSAYFSAGAGSCGGSSSNTPDHDKSGKEQAGGHVVIDSGVFPTGPPVPTRSQKLVRFVETSQLCKGPQDSPGHWIVTGAKLDVENGKISLHVQFSLLCFATAT